MNGIYKQNGYNFERITETRLQTKGVDIIHMEGSKKHRVDEKYAIHFQNKARILNILSEFMGAYAGGRITATCAKNRDIRSWIDVLDKYKLVVVCASTASVPATADLMRAVAKYKNGRIILSGKISGREQDFTLDTNPYNSEFSSVIIFLLTYSLTYSVQSAPFMLSSSLSDKVAVKLSISCFVKHIWPVMLFSSNVSGSITVQLNVTCS